MAPRTSALLQIVADSGIAPLRTIGQGNQQPRALRSLARIIDAGLCHRCGTCIGICPTGVLGRSADEYPAVVNYSACTDCDLCVKTCPGDEFNVQEQQMGLFGRTTTETDTHGVFEEGVVSYATDPKIRERSTSGGLITAMLLDMLRNKEIDGALVIVSDDKELWRGKPIIARSEDEILGAMKSKYAISPTNSALSEIRELPGRYALVGLPCQIHGFRKAAELDARLKERVVLTFGLFCHAAIEHEGMRTVYDSLGPIKSRVRRFISRIGKHPGTPHVELDDGSLVPVYFPNAKGYRPSSIEVINILYRLFTPERCLTCFDATSEFADIAVGDPWMAPPDKSVDFYQGWSYALIRTKVGQAAYQKSLERGAFKSHTLTRREALACNSLMSNEKRWRAFRVIETLKRQGRAVPSYFGFEHRFPRHSGKQFVETELHMLSHVFCYLPSLRVPVLRFFLGPVGYWLFYLNSLRRRLRNFVRDTKERVRRSIWGR